MEFLFIANIKILKKNIFLVDILLTTIIILKSNFIHNTITTTKEKVKVKIYSYLFVSCCEFCDIFSFTFKRVHILNFNVLKK